MESAGTPLPPSGQRLVGGRYRLDHPIDEGGMGEVWRGTDTRLGRAVAIKLLHPAFSRNARFRARFQAEATLVAALNSPGIAILHDYGEDETPSGSQSYLVMELVNGNSLADILSRRGQLSVPRAMRIIAEAADGLDAAHQAGIVHRDVKPGNILVGDNGGVKLINFGIARALGEAGLTETGVVVGTIVYTAPEQLADAEPTPAADVYSLGVVAYECLTGKPPFHSTNPVAIVNGHLTREPPPLPDDIPAPVREAVMTALRKKPSDRWESVAEFGQACWAAVQPIIPRPAMPVPMTREETSDTLSGNEAVGAGESDRSVPIAVTKAPTLEPATGPVAVRSRAPQPATSAAGLPVRSAAVPRGGRSGRTPVAAEGLLRPDKQRRAVARYGLAILLVGLVLAVAAAPWNPWRIEIPSIGNDGREQPLADGDATSGAPAGDQSSDNDKSSSASGKESNGETSKTLNEASGGASNPSGDASGEGNQGDGTKGKVPNLIGLEGKQGASVLASKGFDNSKAVGKFAPPNFNCDIYDQSPKPGTVTSYQTTVTFNFSGSAEHCDME